MRGFTCKKWPFTLISILAKTLEKMKKKKVFVETINMETQTVFHENGNIDIYPCNFEQGKQIVSGETKVSQRGRMVTEDDGSSHFKPYAQNSGKSKYRTLWVQPYGRLMMSKNRLVLTVNVPLSLGYDEVMCWMKNDTEFCLPENTDSHVVMDIKNAIKALKSNSSQTPNS